MKLIFENLDLLLRFVALLQLALAVLNLFIARILNWKPEVDAMSPLVRDVFIIHGWFITITVAMFGILTWRFAPEMAHAPTELSRWLCAAIGIFWGIRCVLQWLHYSPAHWQGKPGRTFIHWLLFVGYFAWTTVYFFAVLA
ncbi:hypothetical protein FEM03_00635 [Phragmitibacter flavus]|uniref:Uncharacterized protein n=1 Tax=Phragmitibacter flavus TaxID=2576071 RepID=A0A5R8KJX0_9BACT|nr:hypothetical protein [Phragmitibacter flavus]TLD72616.1 hypothetical protein FEM03_00635 [Phragmitibacter flavus]